MRATTLVLAFLGALAAFFVAPGVGYADDGLRAGDTAVVAESNGDGVRVRSGPGVSYRVVKALDEGTSVRIITGPVSDGDHDWYQLSVDGAVAGWARARHLDPSGLPTTGARAVGKRVFGGGRSELRSRA